MLRRRPGGAGRGDDQLHLAERRLVPLPARPVPDAGAAGAGGTVWRTYTISSSPSRPLTIGITVKAAAGSIGTRWMVDHLRPGMRIRAPGLAGISPIPMRGDDKYLFISAGTGITPSLSMTNYMFDRGVGQDIVLVHCVRRPAEIICRRRLELMASRVPSIKLHFIVEQEDPSTPGPDTAAGSTS